MKNHEPLAPVIAAIRGATRVVVMSHTNPDPDAYGSSCGLALALRSLGKTVAIVNETGVIARLAWIPGVREIGKQFPAGTWDLVVACDCGDIKRVGDSLIPAVQGHPQVLNIDHHTSNDLFGTLNYVRSEASSTSELVADLIEALGVTWSADIASCLYVGISGDTGSFRYSSTTPQVFELAAQLVRQGADPSRIAKELYGRVSLGALRLQSEVISKLELLGDGKISLAVADLVTMKRCGAEREDADPIVDIIRDIDGVLVGALLKEDQDLWRVSLRSRSEAVDVATLAAKFGGGGHRAAAGFRWRRGREELEGLLRTALVEVLS